MPTTMLTDSYGWVTPNQYRAYRAHNVSPCDADTWHDCFEARGRAPQGDVIAAWVALTARIGLTGDRAAWWADKWRGCSYTAAETAGLVIDVVARGVDPRWLAPDTIDLHTNAPTQLRFDELAVG